VRKDKSADSKVGEDDIPPRVIGGESEGDYC